MSSWDDYQNDCRLWALEAFDYPVVYDERERAQRVLEEAVEVAQSMGMSRAEAHAIVDWKMDGEQGDIQQEVGGLLVCIAILCAAKAIDMRTCGLNELASAHERIGEIRAKQKRKPKFTHLARPR